jgi:non-heme chloroperoxidase
MMCGLKAAYECIDVFSTTDLTDDVRRVNVPTLIVHGDDDQIVLIRNSALKAAKIVETASLQVFPSAPHGLPQTCKSALNEALLSFVAGPDRAQVEPMIEVTLAPA